jgi:HAD superfamily hydrolase (TIGR01509 family)
VKRTRNSYLQRRRSRFPPKETLRAIVAGGYPNVAGRSGASNRAPDRLPFFPKAFIFDVEGTLVDSALATLQCWREVLSEIGFNAHVADLHPFSGMGGKEMLQQLLGGHDTHLDRLIQRQGSLYRELYLPHVRPFAGVRRLFDAIKSNRAKIALATSSDRDELAHYRKLIRADDLIDKVCCGNEVKHEKPRPDVVILAAKKLGISASQVMMVGDTPYDAQAGRAAGSICAGVLTGHFSRADLLDGGCSAVFFDLRTLTDSLDRLVRTADPDVLRPA